MRRLLPLLSLLITLTAQEPAFRFAWFSDTHIGSSGAAVDLRRAVADANSLAIDFTIVSGDITELDIGGNLDTAQAILAELERPCYVIPGNHETKWSASGGQKFAALWGDDKFNIEFGGMRIIGLHQGPLLRMGDGYFVPEDLEWLEAQLTGLSDPGQKLILITHYGLDNSVSNWYEYLDIVKRFNTQMILHGHGHSNKVFDYENVPGIMGRSTLSRGENPGGYNIVSVWPDSARFNERIPGAGTLPAWHVRHFTDHTYPDTTEFVRPDFSTNDAYPQIRVRWQYDCGSAITAAPAVSNGLVITVDGGGTVTALATDTGQRQWEVTLTGALYSTPAVTPREIVVSSIDSTIYCLRLQDGELRWRVRSGAPLVAAPVIAKNAVFCGGSDGVFRALDLNDGRVRWEYSGVEGFVEAAPLVYKNSVIFGAWDGHLYSLNARNGKLKWQWNDGRPGVLYSPAVCQPMAAGNQVFIVAPDRVMSCINLRNGQTLWRTDRFQVRESIGISEDRQTVFVKTMRDTLAAFTTNSRQPAAKWATHAGYGYDIDPAAPVEKDGTVFFGTKDGFVYAVDSATGKIRWHYRVGVGLLNTPLPISAGMVIVTAMDGRTTCLEISSTAGDGMKD